MKKYLFIAALLPLLFACGKEQEVEVVEENSVEEEELVEQSPFVRGAAKVQLSEELNDLVSAELANGKVITKSLTLNDLVDQYGISSIRRLFGEDPRYTGRLHREGLDRWYYITYNDTISATKAAFDMASIPGIEQAEPVRRIKTADFDDPSFSKQWGFYQESGVDINVADVWRDYTTGSPDVIVAVIDQGVDVKHEDLASNCLPGGAGKSHNFVLDNNTITGMSHGTHVAGIIGAVNNNGTGVCGTAGGDYAAGQGGVKIMSCQVWYTADNGQTQSGDFEDAFRYAADNGAIICNNSWGYVFDTNDDGYISAEELAVAKETTIDASTKAAVDYFIKYAGCDDDGNQLADSPMKGGLVIFAAGNDAIQYGAPADYEAVIAVGSISTSGNKSDFSNYGDWVDICAPGTGIYSTLQDNNYGSMNGTSMACPYVSGVAALVVSYRGGQGFTNEDLWDCLIQGANKEKVLNKKIGPLVDALGAVLYGISTPPKNATNVSASAASNNVTVSWTVPEGDDGHPAYGAKVYLATDPSLLADVPNKVPSGVKTQTVVTSGMKIGETATCVFSGLAFDTKYYAVVVPFNYSKEYADASSQVSATTESNNPPVITPDQDISNISLSPSGTLVINFKVTEPDGHTFTVSYDKKSNAENWSKSTSESDTYTLKLTSADAEAGTYTTYITATDAYGLSTTLTIVYKLLENNPPVVSETIENMILNGTSSSENLTLSQYFTDPDGDALTYSVTSSSSSVHATISEGVLYLTGLDYGLSTITVTATDPRGKSVTQTFKVLVREAGVEVSAYPNPVKTTLYIGTGEDLADTSIKIVSETGSEIYDGKVSASAFEPATVDMSGRAPGRYSLNVKYGSVDYSQTIVKK